MAARISEHIFRDEGETVRFAAGLASILTAGDTLLLSGDIGAGKTTFARAVIKALIGPDEDVPSPTFTLVQTYALADTDIWHCDLYRLSDPQEIIELGLEEAFTTAICLVEWPDRLGALAPDTALHLHFTALADGHSVALHGTTHWANRLDTANV